ncbi:MAG: hypothetical protein ACLVCH_05095 [Roseburia inulinivorans]
MELIYKIIWFQNSVQTLVMYFQEMINYGFTLRENFWIADLKRKKPEEQEIRMALEKACFGEIVENHQSIMMQI